MITEGNGASWNVADEYPELGAYIAKLKAANGNKGGTLRDVEVSFPIYANLGREFGHDFR
jgi:hypothetical protein